MARVSKRTFRTVLAVLIAGTVVGAIAACSGVSQEDYDAAQAQLQQQQSQVANLQQQLTDAKANVASIQKQLDEAGTTATGLEKDKASLQQQLTAASADVTSLEQQLKTAQGNVTTLQQQVSSGQAQVTSLQSQLGVAEANAAAPTLLLDVDMVRGHEAPQGPTCALNSQYQRGEMVVWRARISDPNTGLVLPEPTDQLVTSAPTADELTAMSTGYVLEVQLADGQTFPMHFGGHGGRPPADYFWTTSWVIPGDYPTGTVSYQVTASDPNGRIGTFVPREVGSSQLTVLERNELPLVISADVVRGHTHLAGPTCALNSQFPYGELIVWRVRITNAETGIMVPDEPAKLLAADPRPTSDDLTAMSEPFSVVVHLSDGQSFPMHFGAHGGTPPADYFWTTSWEVPDAYPTGTLDYWITAEWSEEGKSGRYDPPNIGSSKLTIYDPASP